MEIRTKIHLKSGYRGRTEICRGEAPEIHEKKLCPKRKSELMAFAVVFDDWLATGKARDYADIASITGLSRFRISKIMNYRQLSVKEQSDLLLGYK
mgnify:CR=1 FL=1